jgi:hypothetical protein
MARRMREMLTTSISSTSEVPPLVALVRTSGLLPLYRGDPCICTGVFTTKRGHRAPIYLQEGNRETYL